MCHSDRRHRRRVRAGARRLGPRQVGRRDRDAPSSGRAPRSRRATTATEIKTKDGLTIQGMLIKEGDPLMMRSMGGVTQIIPADRVALAPADAGVADDERRAAGAHRAGRRRSGGVPARELIHCVASGFSRKAVAVANLRSASRSLPAKAGSHTYGASGSIGVLHPDVGPARRSARPDRALTFSKPGGLDRSRRRPARCASPSSSSRKPPAMPRMAS